MSAAAFESLSGGPPIAALQRRTYRSVDGRICRPIVAYVTFFPCTLPHRAAAVDPTETKKKEQNKNNTKHQNKTKHKNVIIGLLLTYLGRPAGFRTHTLVCTSSTLLILVSVY